MKIENKQYDKFYETVNGFVSVALEKELELSTPQVSSSFLYAASGICGRYFVLKSKHEAVDMESFIKEHIEFFEASFRSWVEHYSNEK